MIIWRLVIIAILYLKLVICNEESYSEALDLRWLPNGDYQALFTFDFTFQSKKDYGTTRHAHFDRFPKVVYDFMHDHVVNEFHLSLTQGMWRYKQFGYPNEGANPSGAELWIWFGPGHDDNQWDLAVNSLAGFFCASLNFMSTAFSGSPNRVLRPISEYHKELNSSSMKYSNLPSENVCTENLTPWKKLLPCEVSSGFVQLLNANQMFNSKYMSLDVNAYKTCKRSADCSETDIAMKLSASVVFDGARFKDVSRTLSLLTLFHRPMGKVCPLADETLIRTKSFKQGCAISISVKNNNGKAGESNIVMLDQNDDRYGDISFDRICQSKDKTGFSAGQVSKSDRKAAEPVVLVHKYLSSTTDGEEKIVCRISNEVDERIKVSYLDLVPWHFRLFVHTLEVTNSNNKVIKPSFFHYVPSQDRERPSTLQLEFSIGAKETVEISVKIRKVLLKWTEHPPDPHHGHACGPSMVYADVHNRSFKIYSEPLIIQLMVPDFSMPYNVLCLSSTIMTIGFSAAQTLATKRYSFVENKTVKGRLKQKLSALKAKLLAMFKRKPKDEKVD